MFRLVFVVFYGSTRSETAAHAHESPGVMIWPLRILAGFSLVGGFIGIESVYTRQFTSEAAGPSPGFAQQLLAPFLHAPVAAASGLIALALGFAPPTRFTRRRARIRCPRNSAHCPARCANRFYFDELYEATVIRLHDVHRRRSPTGLTAGIVGRLLHRPGARRHGFRRAARCAWCRPAISRPTPSCSCSAWRWCCISCWENESN